MKGIAILILKGFGVVYVKFDKKMVWHTSYT